MAFRRTRIGTDVHSPTSAINDHHTVICLSISMQQHCYNLQTYILLESSRNLVQAKMETCLAFCDEANAFQCLIHVSHQPRSNSCTTHFGLLLPLPTIRVTEDKINVGADGFEYFVPLSFSDVLLCGLIQVSQKVAEDINDRLVRRKGRYIFVIEVLLSNEMRRSEM